MDNVAATLIPLAEVDPAMIEALLDRAFGEDRHTRTAYKVREVRGLTFRQLFERRALEDQVSFVSFLRTDGFLLNAGTNPVMGLLH